MGKIGESFTGDRSREQFGSRAGMVLATIGFAAGVGNIWRFPYVVGTNGGGIFILFYLLVVIVIGVPLLITEFSIGAAAGTNPVAAYKKLTPGKRWAFNGYLHVVAAALIASYTTPVYAWILYYIFNTVTGSLRGLDVNAIDATFSSLVTNYGQLFLWSAVNIGLIILVVRRKLQDGVERISKILLPGLGIIMLVLIIKGFTLPNSIEGIKYYITPNINEFTIKSMLAAIGQAFFSIGIAMAVSMVFASYMKREDKDKIVGNAVLVAGFDTLVALAAGFMIFPSVFAFGLEPNAGPGLTFVTMPNVFNQMAGGVIWGTLFYVGFYFAAFTSVVGAWEAVMNYFMEEHRMDRKKSLLVTAILIVGLAIPSILSMEIFDKFDYIENNFILIFGALFMTIYAGWIWGVEKCTEVAGIKNRFAKQLFGILVKYVIPLIIIILTLNLFGII